MQLLNNLKKYIINSSAFIIGVSAGSMNCAKHTFIPKYELNEKPCFIEGLGLCDISIVPHFDINDINQVNETKINSLKYPLIGLPNNSAIYIENGKIEYIDKYYKFDN